MTTIMRITTVSLFALFGALTAPLGAQQANPSNLQVTATGPTTVSLTWTGVAGATGYWVKRAVGAGNLTVISGKLAGTAYIDATAPAGSALRYQVKAGFSSGSQTFSASVSVTTPSAPATTASAPTPPQPPGQPTTSTPPMGIKLDRAPVVAKTTPTLSVVESPPAAPAPTPAADPSGFAATLQGDKVVLSWQPVTGVSWYLLGGPGMGLYGKEVQGTTYSFNSPGPGNHEWTVASLAGQGQGPLNNGANWPKASLSIESLTGKYRVSVAGLRVEHETLDDPWQWDGKRDEVYISSFAQTFERPSGQLLASGMVKSPIHGDINGFPPGSRVRAGSASDLGGIETGDQVSPILGQPAPGASGYPLLVLWEGTLTSSREVVVLHPVLWEADKGDRNLDAYNDWAQYLTSNPTREWGISEVQHPDPQAATWFREGGLMRLAGAVEMMMGLDRNQEDRPIGVQTQQGCYGSTSVCGGWYDHMLILTRERIERALNNPYASGEKGLLELRLSDYYQVPNGARTGSSQQGDYVMLLKVERVP